MGAWGIGHWVVVLLVVVLIFGTKKLKSLGGDLGGAVKGFKDGMRDGSTASEEKPAAPAAQVGTASAEKATIDVEARQKS